MIVKITVCALVFLTSIPLVFVVIAIRLVLAGWTFANDVVDDFINEIKE